MDVGLAAEAILRGELVVMPTETVYGLAANALDPSAVRKIFAAKGRPDNNPLIVHVASVEMAQSLVTAWPANADKLAGSFWPGAMTLVLPKAPHVPGITTGGLGSVALRMPAHPVALALIESAGVPLAAPSANLYTATSPTEVGHLSPAIRRAAAFVLDGGPCQVGLESTVVSLLDEAPLRLRAGQVTDAQLSEALGKPVAAGEAVHSPGMHPRHYAPKARIDLVHKADPNIPALVLGPAKSPVHVSMPEDEVGYAQALYRAFHAMDQAGVSEFQVELPPTDWLAVHDRLLRATR